MRKIPMIFDWQNWLWKSKCGTFWRLVTAPILKIWYFFCVRWFLGKNLLNFVPLPWKLDNPYCILLNCNVGKDKCPLNFVSKNNLSYCLKLCLHSLLQSIIYQTNNQKWYTYQLLFSSYMITSFSSWTFFVLLNAYYGGALTMFFTSEVSIPFTNIYDVMKSYPTWKLKMRAGEEVRFQYKGSAI